MKATLATETGQSAGAHARSTARRGGMLSAAVLLAAAAVTASALVGASGSATANSPSTLVANQVLTAGQSLVSPSGGYRLTMQTDDNLVLYQVPSTAGAQPHALWSTGTNIYPGNGMQLEMQSDGNLVLYTAAHAAVWSTNTVTRGGVSPDTTLQLRDNASAPLAVMDPDPNVGAVWSVGVSGGVGKATGGSYVSHPAVRTSTSLPQGSKLSAGDDLNNGQFRARMQSDGNFVIYDNGTAIFNTHTNGSGPGSYLIYQTDSNIVVYNAAGKALWDSATRGVPADVLELGPDGNLVLYSSTRSWWNTFSDSGQSLS